MKNKEQITKQLQQVSAAIDLIKISQRSQHTSIKEAMRKIMRCISLLIEKETIPINTLIKKVENITKKD